MLDETRAKVRAKIEGLHDRLEERVEIVEAHMAETDKGGKKAKQS